MIYNKFQALQLSALGMGAMRLPTVGEGGDNIDKAAVEEMVAYAMEHGVNYYDTAWGYHNGNSELVMGEVLSKYPRDKFYLASKFPGYDLNNMSKVQEIFEKQLEKCRVEYFDFYLFHNVCELNIDAYLDDGKYGVFTYLMEQKKKGRIKHLGFSAHGNLDTMKRFLDAYGEHMEFCQLQLNFVDWDLQACKQKVDLVSSYHIPVWVMEPLRGGKLAKLPEEDEAKLRALRPDEKIPAWAFRFVQSLPQVTVTLSGMSNLEQLKENIATYEEHKPLNEQEMSALLSVAEGLLAGKLPCTACRYCTSHCPQGLDIPTLLDLYNEESFTGGGFIVSMRMGLLPDEKKPAACIGCKSCEAVCPQTIKISEAMADFAAKLSK